MTPDNDIEGGAHEQWTRHPITEKYKRDVVRARKQALLRLRNAAISSTDINVVTASKSLEGLDQLLGMMRNNAEKEEASRA